MSSPEREERRLTMLDDFRVVLWGRCYALPWENEHAELLAKEMAALKEKEKLDG